MATLTIDELRKIGWSEWDPIGLRGEDGSPPVGAVNEYDSYLKDVVRILDDGAGQPAAANYLAEVAKVHMGLGFADEAAAARTVVAIERLIVERSK